MKTFFYTLFVVFAALSFTSFAADLKFDKDDPASLREYAEKGDPEAQYYLGLHFEAENNMAEAAQWYRKAADQGDLDAQFKLGVCYEKGEGVEEDLKEAAKWYRKAAEKGIVDAQIALGACYEKGVGVGKDVKEVVAWYRKAADRKNVEAQYRLGYCFENYREVRSEDKAAVWYRRAAEKGHAEAQFKIAQFYETGKGVEKKMNEAIPWYTKAAEQGNLDAQLRLGKYYSKVDSKGNPLDIEAAIRWYERAVEQGYQDADLFDMIGSFYENGNYVKQDLKKAFDWYRKAAELGSAHAQARLEQQRLDEEAARKAREEAARKARAREEAAQKARAREEEARRIAREKEEAERKMTISLPGGLKLELIKVEAGSFKMSVKDGENRSNEVPHQVILTHDFYLGKTEVTQAQWKIVMESNPSAFKGDDRPVDQVSWNDAMAFCEKLNEQGKAPSGWKFTLPTESQWEYAARGGNKSKGYKYSGSNSAGNVAWYRINEDIQTQPVGKKAANELGLYDMSGNVWEWCLDDWNDDSSKQTAEFTRENVREGQRVERGGSWYCYARYCRSSGDRQGVDCDKGIYDLGFRLALVPESY